MSDYEEMLKRLYARDKRGRRMGLERVAEVCAQLGNPERTFEAVHVGGTNGKGSVSAFVASMCRAAGKKTGLYTSPHLISLAERIQIDGEPLSREKMVEFVGQAMEAGPDLTFFETMTVAAFLAFRDAAVEIACLEVGLGGRLDATNVIPAPRVACITRIAYDHTSELGSSIESIAAEKAGIIKAGTAVVLGKLHPIARAVIEDRVREVGAHIVPLGSPEPIPGAPLAYPRVAMIGTNLAVAVTAGRHLGISPQQVAQGVEETQWPGRNELLHRSGQELTLLDCAHNPDGTVSLSHMLDPSLLGEIQSRREVAVVFGTIEGKSWRPMLRRLEHVVGHRVYVAPPVPQGVDPAIIAQKIPGHVEVSVADALAKARQLVGPRGLVVVTGSIFLVGAARALLLGLEPDPPIAA